MLAQSTSAQSAEKTVIAGFNTKLAAKVASFKASNSGVSTWLWDSNAAFTTVLNSPTTYGFVDATSYGNTGDFWGYVSLMYCGISVTDFASARNNYHPSAAAQTIWGKDIGTLLSGTVW